MEYTIEVDPNIIGFKGTFQMTIFVPMHRDPEEYIDELLDAIFSDHMRWNCEWEIVS